MLTAGTHTFKATKSGKQGEVTATITDGANSPIMIELGVVGLEPTEPAPPAVPTEPTPAPTGEEFTINIDSTPTRGRLYIDGIYTHHLTPSDANELKDVMHLLTPGTHTIRIEKSGKVAEEEIEISAGKNEPITLTLEYPGLVSEPTEPTAPSGEEFTINIDSTPTRAKLYIDGIYTHHLTPSDANELKDVMHLLTPGKHTFKATKSGMVAEKSVSITSGYNEPIMMTLGYQGLPEPTSAVIPNVSNLSREQLVELNQTILNLLGQ